MKKTTKQTGPRNRPEYYAKVDSCIDTIVSASKSTLTSNDKYKLTAETLASAIRGDINLVLSDAELKIIPKHLKKCPGCGSVKLDHNCRGKTSVVEHVTSICNNVFDDLEDEVEDIEDEVAEIIEHNFVPERNIITIDDVSEGEVDEVIEHDFVPRRSIITATDDALEESVGDGAVVARVSRVNAITLVDTGVISTNTVLDDVVTTGDQAMRKPIVDNHIEVEVLSQPKYDDEEFNGVDITNITLPHVKEEAVDAIDSITPVGLGAILNRLTIDKHPVKSMDLASVLDHVANKELPAEDGVILKSLGMNGMLKGFNPTVEDQNVVLCAVKQHKDDVLQEQETYANRHLRGHYDVDIPRTAGMGLGNMLTRLSNGQPHPASPPKATPPPDGKATKTSDVIIRKSTWYNRLLFNKKPSKFDFTKPINREIGQLSKHKEQDYGTTLPDDKMDMALYSYLLLHKMVKYPSRDVKLEHLSKIAQKYLNEQKEPLSQRSATYIHCYRLTIQRATDEVDGDFLLKKDTTEYDRRGGWLRGLSLRLNRQSLN